eukprot:TRINITY_DN11371_c0_g1_i1.p1 TRINITY_DN11371_c0_g1~~TRINITY_DN11371_c0_g1_i1.p1  ORF type:complete len:117 (-),score=32.19 TRINITY_DN11371_c0_g1_i1:52-354(-)
MKNSLIPRSQGDFNKLMSTQHKQQKQQRTTFKNNLRIRLVRSSDMKLNHFYRFVEQITEDPRRKRRTTQRSAQKVKETVIEEEFLVMNREDDGLQKDVNI